MDLLNSPIEIMGIVAVSAMVTFYALEHRHSLYILLFAAACVASAIYAYLINSYPFLVVELIWAIIAIRRWQSIRAAVS